jgi:hypothetical protein
MPLDVFKYFLIYKEGLGVVRWIYKFIVTSKENKVMITSEAEEMKLPTFEPRNTHIAVTEHLNDYFKEIFGLETNVLRCYKQLEKIRIYEVEVLRKDCLACISPSWIDVSVIDEIEALDKDDQLILRDWRSSPESTAFPWFNKGWREKMEKWVERELSDHSLHFEQIRSWERSALFRIKSQTKNYYFKAV